MHGDPVHVAESIRDPRGHLGQRYPSRHRRAAADRDSRVVGWAPRREQGSGCREPGDDPHTRPNTSSVIGLSVYFPEPDPPVAPPHATASSATTRTTRTTRRYRGRRRVRTERLMDVLLRGWPRPDSCRFAAVIGPARTRAVRVYVPDSRHRDGMMRATGRRESHRPVKGDSTGRYGFGRRRLEGMADGLRAPHDNGRRRVAQRLTGDSVV